MATAMKLEVVDKNADLAALQERFSYLSAFRLATVFDRLVAIEELINQPNPDFYGIRGVVADHCLCRRCEAIRRKHRNFECSACGFHGEPHVMPCTCKGSPCDFTKRERVVRFSGCGEHGFFGCPTCGNFGKGKPLDGGEGLWQMIRDIRTVLRPR